MTEPRSRSRWLALGVLIASLLAVVGTLGGVLPKLDYGQVPTRAAWQRPTDVIQSLEIQRGDQVADIGAGDGYFTFMLADAVGPTGTVYAVDVTDESIDTLKRRTASLGYTNVRVIKGEFTDPLLPDGQIDLAFFSNSFHHIDDQPLYFDSLRTDLSSRGRVAIIEPKPMMLVRVLSAGGHWSSLESIGNDMAAAHYRPLRHFDFLPIQHFVTFQPTQ